MNRLSKRVKEAKKLTYSHNPYTPRYWSTWGSKGKDYGEKYYRQELNRTTEIINGKIVTVFLVSCQKDVGDYNPCDCPGNSYHTVCKHCLGAIYNVFKEGKEKLVSFYSSDYSYEEVRKMTFGGTVAKVKSVNGRGGYLWCVVRDWPTKPEILTVEENIALMRGSEDEEGID